MSKNIKVFSLTSSVEVTKKVCERLNIQPGEVDVKHFADGEIYARALETVRGQDVYVIQSTCNPVTDRLMELLVFVDSLRRASAKEITVIIPYFGYARQDRKAASREPITAALVANLLETAGIDRVVMFDLHSPQIQGFFDCPVDNLTAVPKLGAYFKEKLKGEDIVVVSPDHGGVVRARKLAEQLNATIAIFDKRRPKPNVAEMCDVIGEIKNKVCILVDDMIDTGGTIVAASEELMKRGAKCVYAGCTHAVFSRNAIEKLENSPIIEIVTTNTIEEERKCNKLHVLDISDMIERIILCIENGESIAPLYDLIK